MAPGEGFPFMLRPSAREGAPKNRGLIFYRSPLFLYRSNILKNNPLPLTKIFLHCLQTGILSKKTCPRRLTFRFSGRYLQCTGPGLWKDIRSRLLSPPPIFPAVRSPKSPDQGPAPYLLSIRERRHFHGIPYRSRRILSLGRGRPVFFLPHPKGLRGFRQSFDQIQFSGQPAGMQGRVRQLTAQISQQIRTRPPVTR